VALPLVSLVLVHRNPLLDVLSVDFARGAHIPREYNF
jgi:hypothetical protein